MGSPIKDPSGLSPHGRRICFLLMEGYSSEEIARAFGGRTPQKPSNIDLTIHRILRATGTRNRAHLVAWFLGASSHPHLHQKSFISTADAPDPIDVSISTVPV